LITPRVASRCFEAVWEIEFVAPDMLVMRDYRTHLLYDDEVVFKKDTPHVKLYKTESSFKLSTFTEIITIAGKRYRKNNHNEHIEHVIKKGKNSLEEQVASRMVSRIRKKMDAGYSIHVPTTSTQLNARLVTPKQNFVDGVKYFQPKLDGHRAGATNKMIYSRGGKMLDLPHLEEELSGIPDGIILDGELYRHDLTSFGCTT